MCVLLGVVVVVVDGTEDAADAWSLCGPERDGRLLGIGS